MLAEQPEGRGSSITVLPVPSPQWSDPQDSDFFLIHFVNVHYLMSLSPFALSLHCNVSIPLKTFDIVTVAAIHRFGKNGRPSVGVSPSGWEQVQTGLLSHRPSAMTAASSSGISRAETHTFGQLGLVRL